MELASPSANKEVASSGDGTPIGPARGDRARRGKSLEGQARPGKFQREPQSGTGSAEQKIAKSGSTSAGQKIAKCRHRLRHKFPWMCDEEVEEVINARLESLNISKEGEKWVQKEGCPAADNAESIECRMEAKLRALEKDPRVVLASFWNDRSAFRFAVYRPVSYDSIRLLASGGAVGKPSYIKGKTAKTGPCRAFVPLLQVSTCQLLDRALDKAAAAADTPDKVMLFFGSEVEWRQASGQMKLDGCRELHEEGVFPYGFEVPFPVVLDSVRRIMQDRTLPKTGRPDSLKLQVDNLSRIGRTFESDITVAIVGWIDEQRLLELVLGLWDTNSRQVFAVTSDFDAALIGTKGSSTDGSAADEQLRTSALRMLHLTEHILERPSLATWPARWEVELDSHHDFGIPEMPLLGFGNPVHNRITGELAKATRESKAVNHGEEAFNIFWPQEMDKGRFLVCDRDFQRRGWAYLGAEELIAFLTKKLRLGYTFPMNPHWPVMYASGDFAWRGFWLTTMPHQVEVWGQDVVSEVNKLCSNFPGGFERSFAEAAEGSSEHAPAPAPAPAPDSSGSPVKKRSRRAKRGSR